MRQQMIVLLALAVAVAGTRSVASAALKAWRDMGVGSPSDPAASWFQNASWTPIPGGGVPAAGDDVTFGGPLSFDHPTDVRFFSVDLGVGYPNAVAQSFVADSATSPNPALSSLVLNMGDPANTLPFAGTFTVGQGVFDLGNQYLSTAHIAARLWDVSHLSTTNPLRIARNGATASVSVTDADLSVAFRLEIGRGFDSATTTQSMGSAEVVGNPVTRSTVAVGDRAVVGVAGGQGTLHLNSYTDTTIDGLLAVGSGAPLTATGVVQSNAQLFLNSGFDDSTLDITNELLVGVDSALGEINFQGDVSIGTDALGSSFVIGRNAVDDTVNSQVVRGNGGVTFQGTSTTAGSGFVGIDGAGGSIGWDFGGHTVNGDLVIGDLGFNSTIDGYVPSTASAGIGLNTFVEVTGDLFIGNNKSVGNFTATPSGDGGSGLSADYVSVGELGTGQLNIANMITVTFNHLEIKLASGTQAYEEGGTVNLGSNGSDDSARLSVSRLSARGEGDRFNWQSATLQLRDGIIDDWGSATFTVPELGRFEGAGTADVDRFVNRGLLDVGYYESFPTFNDSLIVTGDFINNNGSIYLLATSPTRFGSGNGDETIIINGDSSFIGGTIELVITNNVGGYDWYTDIQIGDTFNFFDFVGGTPSLAFPTVNLPFLPPEYVWNTSQFWTDGVIIVNAVPEPGGLALVACVAAAGLSRRRQVSDPSI
jgi:hypothetical protein